MENVVLVSVAEPSLAYQAFSEVRHLSGAGAVKLRGAAVIERTGDGGWRIPESTSDGSYDGALFGGAIGALVGVFLGPFGLLLGGAAGAMIGGASDLENADATQMVLALFPSRVPPGSTALVADVDETAPEVLDSAMAPFGSLQRVARAEVEAEVEAASAAAAEEKEDEAARAQRQRRQAAGDETLRDRFASLKDRLTGRS